MSELTYNIGGFRKMKNYLIKKEREIIKSQIDDINLIYGIKSNPIIDSILYMFLYQSNFYSYVEINEKKIYDSFYNDYLTVVDEEDREDKEIEKLNRHVKKALEKLSSKNILFYRRKKYILNKEIFKKIIVEK